MNRGGFEIGFLNECLKSINTYLKTFIIVHLLDSCEENGPQIAEVTEHLRLGLKSQKLQRQRVYQYHDVEACIKRLQKSHDKGIILLVSLSEPLNDEQKLRFCSFLHVKCIYEFGSEDPCIKLNGTLNNDNNLLQNDSFLTDISPDARNSSLANMDRTTKIFAHKYILLELLQQISCTTKEKEMFINFCLTKCRHDKDRNDINQYNSAYFEKKAIWWYTGDTIIPHTINRIMREDNLNSIIKNHYFINELYSELYELYREQLSKLKRRIQLYRGKPIYRKELCYYEKSVNQLVVINSFLSVTEDEDVARVYSGDGNTQSEDKVSVIFSMEFHMKDNISKAAASIRCYSQKQDHEKEFLLSFGIVMRIASVTKDVNIR